MWRLAISVENFKKVHKNCSSKITLNKHIRIVHELAGKNLNKCGDCEKAFKEEQGLKDHIRIVHEGKRDFRCDLCEKHFGRKETMKTHLALVHGKVEMNDAENPTTRAVVEKKYSCEFCEKSYTQPHNLKSHMESCHRLIEENDSKLPQNDTCLTNWLTRKTDQIWSIN